MPCPISARMTDEKCRALVRANNVACKGCTEQPTRKVMVEMPVSVYEAIRKDAVKLSGTVEDYIAELMELVADGRCGLKYLQ